jgi:hypothetical protein
MEEYCGHICPMLEDLQTYTELHMFKPEAPLEKFLIDNHSWPSAVFCPIHIVQDVRTICTRDGQNGSVDIRCLKPGCPAEIALGGPVRSVRDLKERVLSQLTPLTECSPCPAYDPFTDNYYNYYAPVRIPSYLAELLERTIPWFQDIKDDYPFGEVVSLFYQHTLLKGWNSSRIGLTPAIEVGEKSLVPILGGHVLARGEIVEWLAKCVLPTSTEPAYWQAKSTEDADYELHQDTVMFSALQGAHR